MAKRVRKVIPRVKTKVGKVVKVEEGDPSSLREIALTSPEEKGANKMLGTEEAAKVIGCGSNHIRLMCQKGTLKSVQVPTRFTRTGFAYEISEAECLRVKSLGRPNARGGKKPPRSRPKEEEGVPQFQRTRVTKRYLSAKAKAKHKKPPKPIKRVIKRTLILDGKEV